jgi:hypothetical protein
MLVVMAESALAQRGTQVGKVFAAWACCEGRLTGLHILDGMAGEEEDHTLAGRGEGEDFSAFSVLDEVAILIVEEPRFICAVGLKGDPVGADDEMIGTGVSRKG